MLGIRRVNRSEPTVPERAVCGTNLRLTRVRGVPFAGEALHNFSLINKHNRPDDHTVTLVDIEWHAHEEHVLLAEQSIDVE